MKIATIGSGFIVDRFMDAAKQVDGIEVYGVYSRTEERAKAFAEKHAVQNYFTDIDQIGANKLSTLVFKKHYY